jgi:hypothetical protein
VGEEEQIGIRVHVTEYKWGLSIKMISFSLPSDVSICTAVKNLIYIRANKNMSRFDVD